MSTPLYCDRDSDIAWSNGNKNQKTPGIHREAKLLEAIALFLTTGHKGDVVATAFDKHRHLTILLMKNHPCTPSDKSNAAHFFDALSVANIDSDMDIIRVVASYSATNINKRVGKVLKGLDEVDVRSLIEQYVPGPLKKDEFHKDDPVVEAFPNLDTKQLLEKSFGVLRLGLEAFYKDSYSLDSNLDTFLSMSQFGYWFFKSQFVQNPPTRTPAFETFRRRLAKLGQYYRGISRLLNYCHRLSGQILSYQWLEH